MKKILTLAVALVVFTSACQPTTNDEEQDTAKSELQMKLDEYAEFTLTTDMSKLTEKEKEMIPILIEVAEIMDGLFWQEAYGDKQELMAGLEDPAAKGFAEINYGPWDRLGNNAPFVEGVGEKSAGAQFYPADMTKEEFEAFESENKTSLYTLVKRNESGELYTQYYHEAFAEEVQRAADLLRQAAELAEDEGLKNYLSLRAEGLQTTTSKVTWPGWI